MTTAFSLRTKRPAKPYWLAPLDISLPPEVAETVRAEPATDWRGLERVRLALWRTDAARALKNSGSWNAFPGVQQIRSLRESWTESEPKSWSEWKETWLKSTNEGNGNVDLDQIFKDFVARAERERWVLLLEQVVLLFKYGAVGLNRPLGEAVSLLRVIHIARDDQPLTKDETEQSLRKVVRTPLELARPQTGTWLKGTRPWDAGSTPPGDIGPPAEAPHHVLAEASRRSALLDWSRTRTSLTRALDAARSIGAIGQAVEAGADLDKLVVHAPLLAREAITRARAATDDPHDVATIANSMLASGLSAEARSGRVMRANLAGSNIVFERREDAVVSENTPGVNESSNPRIGTTPDPWQDTSFDLPIDVRELVRDLKVFDPSWGGFSPEPDIIYEGPSFLSPSGVSDLLLVETTWKRYEMAEIESITNVMVGETKTLTTRDETSTLLETYFETERSESEATYGEVQNRSNIKEAAEETIQEDLRASGSVAVSSQGPTVTVTAEANASAEQLTTSASQAIAEYAKSVTRRSEEKVAQRVLQNRRESVTRTRSHEDVGVFTRDANASDHATGVYRYVELVSEAKVFQYGVRTLYDIVVPEPAAVLWHLATQTQDLEILAEQPDSELLRTINAENIADKRAEAIAAFGPIEFDPMPQPITLGWSFAQTGRGNNAKIATTGEISVPEGYEATEFSLTVAAEGESEDLGLTIFVSIAGTTGAERIDIAPSGSTPSDIVKRGPFSISASAGVLPVAVSGENFQSASGQIAVSAQPSTETLNSWRLACYSAVVSAFRAAESKYQQARAQALAFEPEETIRLPEGASRRLEAMMRFEIQRAVLAVIRNEPVDYSLTRSQAFSGGEVSFPTPDLVKLDEASPELRFLQQAFEWEQMSWVLYPYFWGRRQQWHRLILQDHPDPDFAAFLRAGAARVQIPVRPGFEGLVAHYLETKEVYPDGIPEVGEDGHLSFIAEQLESFGAPGEKSAWPKDSPLEWEVRQGTTFTKLDRLNASLPRRS